MSASRPDPRARDAALVLAIDLGTSGLKVGFVTLAGRLVWQCERTLSTTWVGAEQGAEQDAEHWWKLISAAVIEGVRHIDADSVVAVGITGQWASTVPVDAAGRTVAPCAMWQDRRAVPLVRARIGGPVSGYDPRALTRWVRTTGGVPNGNDPAGHMLRFEADPEIAAAARWYLEPVDYLAMRFTGVAAASHASMTASWLTDNRDLTKLHYDAELVGRLGINADKLPPLRATGSVIGPIEADVAAGLGLPATVQVITGILDLHAAIVGSGAVEPGAAHLALSTTSWISMPLPVKRTDVLRGIATIPGLFGEYALANNHDSSGSSLRWLRDNLLAPPDGLLGPGQVSFDDLTALAATSPPGADGVVFTPWLQGLRHPTGDSRVRATFTNLGLQSTQADLIRSLLEGVAHNNRWLLECVDRFARRCRQPPIESLRCVGGGASSDLWCQIHADVLGRTIERVADPVFAQLRGVALYAGVALGVIERADIADLVPVSARFEPDPRTAAVYDRAFAEFTALFKATRPIHRRLR